jgi:hypothetical protein
MFYIRETSRWLEMRPTAHKKAGYRLGIRPGAFLLGVG